MAISVVGVSHHTAPIEVRERIAFSAREVPPLLSGLVGTGTVGEAVVLSTCNRTEIYSVLPELAAGEAEIRALLAERAPGSAAECGRYLYARRDRGAVEHLLRVSSGLDSMVVGEPQIQGQVREAYRAAAHLTTDAGPVVGPTLNRLFQLALGIGGRVRSETELGRGAASMSTAAVELAKKIFGSLEGRRALVVGAGEMSETTLDCLRAEGVRTTLVVNRTFDRAAELAARWSGRAIPWSELGDALRGVDIAICSTAAPHPVLSVDRVRESMPNGAKQPLCIIDLALPRDVDPRVGGEPNVFLYNIDDLQEIVEDNLGRRRSELPRAESIVAEGVEDYWGWYSSLAVVPTIRDLREHAEAVRREELEKALRRLEHLPAEDREAVEQMTRSLLNKLLHSPTVRLREAAGNGRGTSVLDAVRYLFGLDRAGAGPRSDPEEMADTAAETSAAASRDQRGPSDS